jgi:nicotinamide-nucleotide amidase
VPEPTAIICLTGSELTRGETRDLNGSFLADELTRLGAYVAEVRLLPDDARLLEATFREVVPRADIVLVSGGLGPTADDLTIAALAAALGHRVVRDPPSLERLREFAAKRGRKLGEIPDNYFKQAEVVAGAVVLANPVGLAPGSLVETERGLVAAMPGVPRELRAMFRQVLAPEIARRFRLEPPRILRALVLGQPESWVEARVQALGIDFAKVEYGISAKPGEITLKFLARDPAHHGAIDDFAARLAREFGEDLAVLPDATAGESASSADFAFTRLVHGLLLEKCVTVATAESCTGGWIAKRLTDCAGSSAYFLGAAVAYDNRVKTGWLGIDAALLAEHGAVSEPVCRAMALAARQRFGADYGIGVTGIAGPSGASEEKPVGLVYIGLARPGGRPGETVSVERNVFHGDRDMVRSQAALRALDLLRRELRR